MPRILTNKFFLPDAFVRAVKNEKYSSRGNISITSLIDSPRVRLLKKHHTYEEDVSSTVWALFGTAVHAIIERSSEFHDDVENEMQLSMMIDDWEVTGTCDMYEKSTCTITDWKVTSVWKVIKGLSDDDGWVKQTNCYAAMIRAKGLDVKSIKVIAILKDWKAREAMYNADYPQQPVVTLHVPVYSHQGMIDYMTKRVKLHKEAEQLFYNSSSDGTVSEDKLPVCTPQERWSTGQIWKMVTSQKKRSIKNFTIENKHDEEDAIAFHTSNLKKYPDLTIKKEMSQDRRCAEYCPVNSHCLYWNAIKHRYEYS